MSKGIMNRRDKLIWDNSAKPTIDNVMDKIDQVKEDCTYTAGDGINIDEDNKVSVNIGTGITTDGGKIEINTVFSVEPKRVGIAPNGQVMWQKAFNLSSITGQSSVPLGLVGEISSIYVLTGYAKNSSGFLTLNDIDISFTNTTMKIDAGTNSYDQVVVIIYFTYKSGYVELSTGNSYAFSRNGITCTFTKKCFVMRYTSYTSQTKPDLIISLESGVVGRASSPANLDIKALTAYTYNGHTIYYSLHNGFNYDGTYVILDTAINNGEVTAFKTYENALQAFIDDYF